jgi:hypothetical protein
MFDEKMENKEKQKERKNTRRKIKIIVKEQKEA